MIILKKYLTLTCAFVFLSACNPNTDLEEANKKIAKLQSEIKVLKEKNAQGQKNATNESKLEKITNIKTDEPKIDSNWRYSQKEDQMTGTKTYFAAVNSSNEVEFKSPYNGKQRGKLLLRDSQRNGKEVIFAIEKGQILCRSYNNCSVLVRFDEEKPVRFSATEAADYSTETIFIDGVKRFVDKLIKAKTIRISVEVYQQGSPIFSFDVQDLDLEKFKPKIIRNEK